LIRRPEIISIQSQTSANILLSFTFYLLSVILFETGRAASSYSFDEQHEACSPFLVNSRIARRKETDGKTTDSHR
jgi:hypothetical protein